MKGSASGTRKAKVSARVVTGRGTGRFEEVKHPRGAGGKFVTTGGLTRAREGTQAQRDRLAREIRTARAKVKTKLGRHNLAYKIKSLRQARRGHGAGKATVEVKPTPAIESTSLNVARRKYADDRELEVAKGVGGTRLDDYQPHDVLAPKAKGDGDHAIEVKSLIYGKKKQLAVHENALLLKIKDAAANPNRTYHTIVVDSRNVAEGGAHAANYSGHTLYYRRACGPYTVTSMHKVKDMAELRKLMDMPDESLPAAARGAFPVGPKLKELRARAAREKAYNDARSKERKARLGAAAYGK